MLGVPSPSQSRDTLLVSTIQALFPHPAAATLPSPGTGRSTGFSGRSGGGPCVLPHLWSGLGLPFFLMLLAVVSLKCSRPTVTLVTCSGGRLTLAGKENKGMSEDGASLGMVPISSYSSPISSFLRWEGNAVFLHLEASNPTTLSPHSQLDTGPTLGPATGSSGPEAALRNQVWRGWSHNLERRIFWEWPSPGLLHHGTSMNWAQGRVGNAKRGKQEKTGDCDTHTVE